MLASQLGGDAYCSVDPERTPDTPYVCANKCHLVGSGLGDIFIPILDRRSRVSESGHAIESCGARTRIGVKWVLCECREPPSASHLTEEGTGSLSHRPWVSENGPLGLLALTLGPFHSTNGLSRLLTRR